MNKGGEMEGINHRIIEVNRIKIHIAEKGEGPVVLFLHGFPECWYSWRHQIVGLASRGFHAVAPDLRGYGGSESPAELSSYSVCHLVGDIVGIIDFLGQDQVFVVGHDWGALLAWYLCMFRPERVKAVLNISIAIRNPNIKGKGKPMDFFRSYYGEEYHLIRYQEPGGVIEAEFARLGAKLVVTKFLTNLSPEPLYIPKTGWGSPNDQIDLPSWLSEEDIDYYASQFKKTGFTGAINYYRNFDLNSELLAPWAGMKIKAPAKFIIGDQGFTYHYPGFKDYIHSGGLKQNVPLLEEVVVMPGVSHYPNLQKPHDVTNIIYEFFKKF